MEGWFTYTLDGLRSIHRSFMKWYRSLAPPEKIELSYDEIQDILYETCTRDDCPENWRAEA